MLSLWFRELLNELDIVFDPLADEIEVGIMWVTGRNARKIFEITVDGSLERGILSLLPRPHRGLHGGEGEKSFWAADPGWRFAGPSDAPKRALLGRRLFNLTPGS